MGTRGQVYLVDDEALVRQATEQWLQLAGFSVTGFDDAKSALQAIDENFPGVLITDVKMPIMDGQELLREVLKKVPDLPVILVTGHGDVTMAIQSVREGAYDFIEKPYDPDQLVETVHRACEKRHLIMDNRRLQRQLAEGSGIETRIIGVSAGIVALRRELLRLAKIDTNVIIYGETGCGKELVAQCLHEFGPRSARRFVPLNCGAIPENLFESELFGHEAGAFTGASKRRIGKFEYAEGGTLFMDEIEGMPLNLQIKVLRTLQEGSIERLGDNRSLAVDVRVIAATKIELKGEESFRQDLYYRLNVGQLYIPPLRERQEDIPLLFEHFSRQAASSHDIDYSSCSAQEMRSLQQYSWPGNVRELRNIAMRYGLDPGCNLTELLVPTSVPLIAEVVETGLPLGIQVQNFEAQVLRRCLKKHRGNILSVMDELDLPRRTLNQKMQKYGINRADFKG
ncbi:sigma-54 dependent transcriptional regulator [Motiliproteus sp. MSK22-1]|uniref:sigma-54-dependent transcriptional regulator n=1 Tax=Motiliproteus sp. MSK22-1 TaxID=1897630 RepID=UPI000976A331|nr:sigma-54 dependent transcriptional regulator [Motiliproteus sp. MSK22-1]OMH33982.1 C4-dicarboxylate ABC transporter [Motiliproteus sp. MSK22-1]